jgi:hypothetical protein
MKVITITRFANGNHANPESPRWDGRPPPKRPARYHSGGGGAMIFQRYRSNYSILGWAASAKIAAKFWGNCEERTRGLAGGERLGLIAGASCGPTSVMKSPGRNRPGPKVLAIKCLRIDAAAGLGRRANPERLASHRPAPELHRR